MMSPMDPIFPAPDRAYPTISIVTPSLNQGAYLEEAILSVIGQNYPNLEYILMDGGSDDGSVDIIKKYAGRISHWESRPDHGQADAINRGFSMAGGDILAWLNSDDFYLPGTLLHVAGLFETGTPQVVFGDCVVIREDRHNRAYAMQLGDRVQRPDFLNGSLAQSSAFWTRQAWLKTGPLDAGMRYAFDLEWFNRARRAGVPFIHTAKHLSVFRSHEACKTNTGREDRQLEIARVYGTYRNEAYEEVFIDLSRRREQVSRMGRLMSRMRLLAGARARKRVFRSVFPGLRRIADEDFDFFLKRITGPLK